MLFQGSRFKNFSGLPETNWGVCKTDHLTKKVWNLIWFLQNNAYFLTWDICTINLLYSACRDIGVFRPDMVESMGRYSLRLQAHSLRLTILNNFHITFSPITFFLYECDNLKKFDMFCCYKKSTCKILLFDRDVIRFRYYTALHKL